MKEQELPCQIYLLYLSIEGHLSFIPEKFKLREKNYEHG
jgi:hypothetical protein